MERKRSKAAFSLKKLFPILLICSVLIGCTAQTHATHRKRHGKLGRGISIGNALDAPRGDSWGVEMKEEYFDAIKEAGFDFVRLPVRFSDYLNPADKRLDEAFLRKVDGCISHGLSLGLNIILDLHHYERMMTDPGKEYDNFIAIWRQLAGRYADYPDTLVFELLNEPRDKLGGELLNRYLNDAVGVIRETNPDRRLIVGGDRFNSPERLEALSLPEDENIIVTFHYYQPAEFTFQGNEHHEGYESLRDVRWVPGEAELARIHDDFERVRLWAKQNSAEVLLGEFGAVKTIPAEYRGPWIRAVVTAAEEMGFSWCYWELGSWFGIMDVETMLWDHDMLRILLREK